MAVHAAARRQANKAIFLILGKDVKHSVGFIFVRSSFFLKVDSARC